MTTATAPLPEPLVPGIDPHALVLAERPLALSALLQETSRFADDVWNLTPAVHKRHQRAWNLHFESIPDRFRTVVKELIYRYLVNDLPPGVTPSSIETIVGRFYVVKEFITWVSHRGVVSLSDLTAEDFEQWGQYVDTRHKSDTTRTSKRFTARTLWLFRSKLPSGGLAFDPEEVWYQGYRPAAPRATGENSTERIPEQVLSPLLIWALRWVEDFSDDVVRAQQEWNELKDLPVYGRQSPAPPNTPSAYERLEAVLDRYRSAGRKLPLGWKTNGPYNDRPPVNHAHLARQAQCDRGTPARGACAALVNQAAEELGIDDGTYLWTEVRSQLDERSWLHAIAFDEVKVLLRLLHAACYIVIAYLSGMRDSEVKHMRRGCLTTWRDDTGNPARHYVKSMAYKGEDTPTGVEATWVVAPSVARAVDVLEATQPAGQEYLFASVWHERDTVRLTGLTNKDMRDFMRWINSYSAEHSRPDSVPDVNGKAWNIKTSQFRRTLAWFVARQEGGTIAGAIQYRHHSVQMFEGYAGTSASDFRQEVEAEQAVARGEKLGDIILTGEFQRLTGPAGREAEERLTNLEHHVQFHGKVIPDRKRLERHMKRHDPHIYPGEFVTCVHNPDRALCRKDKSDGPSLPDCQPLQCRNVALSHENIDAFHRYIRRLDQAVEHGIELAPFVRARLEKKRIEVACFLTANGIPASDLKEAQ
ncbi:hypothetical protein [Streptomyces sp. A30]|uniref:hypothetical protein n=1 Tax=Streptomyces sp. A30 TaxID=2789273 RepID=UPI003981443A